MSEETIEILWPAKRRADVFLTDVVLDAFTLFKNQSGRFDAQLVSVDSSNEMHTDIKTGTRGNYVHIGYLESVPKDMVLIKIRLPAT